MKIFQKPIKDGNLILYCNILVITCIVFSIPLAQYPARSAIWNLIHTLAPPSLNFPVVSFKVFNDSSVWAKMDGPEISPLRIRSQVQQIVHFQSPSVSQIFCFGTARPSAFNHSPSKLDLTYIFSHLPQKNSTSKKKPTNAHSPGCHFCQSCWPNMP